TQSPKPKQSVRSTSIAMRFWAETCVIGRRLAIRTTSRSPPWAPRRAPGAYCLDPMRLPRAPKALRRSGSSGAEPAPDHPSESPPGPTFPAPAAPEAPRRRRRPVRKLPAGVGGGIGAAARLPVRLVARVSVPDSLRNPTSAVLIAVIVVLLALVILGGRSGGLGLSGGAAKGAIVD